MCRNHHAVSPTTGLKWRPTFPVIAGLNIYTSYLFLPMTTATAGEIPQQFQHHDDQDPKYSEEYEVNYESGIGGSISSNMVDSAHSEQVPSQNSNDGESTEGSTGMPESESGVETDVGVLLISDGSCYEGDVSRGQADGVGSFTWPNGTFYVGECEDGEVTGYGVLVSVDSRRVEGCWVGGKVDGAAVCWYPDGSRYEGIWSDDKPHGFGLKTFSSLTQLGDSQTNATSPPLLGAFQKGELVHELQTAEAKPVLAAAAAGRRARTAALEARQRALLAQQRAVLGRVRSTRATVEEAEAHVSVRSASLASAKAFAERQQELAAFRAHVARYMATTCEPALASLQARTDAACARTEDAERWEGLYRAEEQRATSLRRAMEPLRERLLLLNRHIGAHSLSKQPRRGRRQLASEFDYGGAAGERALPLPPLPSGMPIGLGPSGGHAAGDPRAGPVASASATVMDHHRVRPNSETPQELQQQEKQQQQRGGLGESDGDGGGVRASPRHWRYASFPALDTLSRTPGRPRTPLEVLRRRPAVAVADV